MDNKVVPHNTDAEQSVLGSMFISKKALQKGLEVLNSELFYLDSHSKIFTVMKNLDINAAVADMRRINRHLRTEKRRNK